MINPRTARVGVLSVSLCVCSHFFSQAVSAMKTRRGYVGKYTRCSILTETGVVFPRVRHCPGSKRFLGVCVN